MIKFLMGENSNHLVAKAYRDLNFHSLKYMLAATLMLGLMSTPGCSSPPEPTPQPSKKETRDNADRFFEKMEKEKSNSPIQ